MILCSWLVLCLNKPAFTDSHFQLFWRKLYLTALGFLRLEFIVIKALSQWVSACCSVQNFHWIDQISWTMIHAFFADMKDFMLHMPEWPLFLINIKQLHYLVSKSYVNFLWLNKHMIVNKNKADDLLWLITLSQILWFIITVFDWVTQKLFIICVELTVTAFIICSVRTIFF